MDLEHWPPTFAVLAFGAMIAGPVLAQDPPATLNVQWDKPTRVSRTTATLQVVVNPPLRRGTPVHDGAFQALKELEADYVRYVPWLPYPRLGVAELEPPKDGKTSWDFSVIDPMTIDFLEATKGHPVVLNFSTIPQWMVKTDKPVSYPDDPDQVVWDYTQGSDFRDPSFKEVADYYARLLAWYTRGGFTDEAGQRHASGHHYPISHWEVLNEPDLERRLGPEVYTRLYDEVVGAMRRVQPATKFGAISLARPALQPEFFEYFLNPKNHRPGIPLDFITYHFYASPTADQGPEVQPHVVFAQADGFLTVVRFVEAIRKRLSPGTETMINEIGAISADDRRQKEPGHVTKPIPASYWNLTGGLYAYIFGELTRMGVEVAAASQLVGYPTQYPSVSMVDWTNGAPNPRFWVLKLLRDGFGPGDEVVTTELSNPYVYTLGVVKRDGKRRALLVNKRDRGFEITVPGAGGGWVATVDQTTGFRPPAATRLTSDKLALNGLAVAVVTLP